MITEILACLCLLVKMMESCFTGKPERVGPVEVEDIRRDLLGEFAALPLQVCMTVTVCLPVSLDVADVTGFCWLCH